MSDSVLQSKENIKDSGPHQDPAAMAETIANQAVTITHQAATISNFEDTIQKMNDTILKLNKEIEKLKGEVKQLEIELQNEKERRGGSSSDSFGSPPLVKN